MTEKSLDDYLNELSMQKPVKPVVIPQIKTFRNPMDDDVNSFIVRNYIKVLDIKFVVEDTNTYIMVVYQP